MDLFVGFLASGSYPLARYSLQFFQVVLPLICSSRFSWRGALLPCYGTGSLAGIYFKGHDLVENPQEPERMAALVNDLLGRSIYRKCYRFLKIRGRANSENKRASTRVGVRGSEGVKERRK